LLSAQQLFRIGDEISGFDIKVRNLEDVDRLSLEIPQFMGYPYYARTMFQSYRNLFTWIDLQKKPVPIILGLIIIVATVNIIGTLLMIILERSREIGILRTIGATKKRIQQIFLIQGMFIGIIGTILGNLAALGICWLEMKYHFFSLPSGIYYMANVPIELNIINFAIVSSIALVMCYVSSLLPARVASKLDPIITLRFS
jgi:lipoprotein-releasing system permease protein